MVKLSGSTGGVDSVVWWELKKSCLLRHLADYAPGEWPSRQGGAVWRWGPGGIYSEVFRYCQKGWEPYTKKKDVGEIPKLTQQKGLPSRSKCYCGVSDLAEQGEGLQGSQGQRGPVWGCCCWTTMSLWVWLLMRLQRSIWFTHPAAVWHSRNYELFTLIGSVATSRYKFLHRTPLWIVDGRMCVGRRRTWVGWIWFLSQF